ncbi:potassium/sodium efflux P-type ATPase [Halteromyces radiatus]|uniref:potassium/sodium efflux P-type ATPase n=1 Tax=Halteromyces radiatus TaxID=101107 RepID=UPI00221E6B70|nr:potassium/sodium efflux P-type ATPase [Halteromyces radiatus]KAI8082721.1 potassium/sodium efflux P-type ATPase [Halteromyces radiatus]
MTHQDQNQTTIQFDALPAEGYRQKYANNEKISQKPLTRSSTGQSSGSFDTKSVRSVVMKRMKLVKRFKKKKKLNNAMDEQEDRVEGPPYHTMDLTTVAELLKTDLEDGLSDQDIEQRRAESGYNEMEGEGGVNPFQLLLKQFLNVMVLILLIAMVVSFVFKDWIEGGVICAIMFLNAGVGFAQEFKAEKTMDSLRQMASPTSVVVRNGHQKTIGTRELVPGDIIILKSGDVVGADCRIVEAFNMDIDEALLTGESLPVNKMTEQIEGEEVPLGDRVNMTYSSTVLTKGRGKALVTAIGMQTEIGRIAKRLLDSGDNQKTPLQKSLDRMAWALLAVAILSVIIVFACARFHINDDVILYAISTAISVIPEGLVAVVTLTQAFGVHSMAKRKALVRRLAALELLGAVTNICSDKTGTLTQSKMVLTRLWRPDSGFFSISGLGFDIKGDMIRENDDKMMDPADLSNGLRYMTTTAALCNMSEIRKNKTTGEWNGIGDPTEVALQVFAYKMNMGKPSLTKPSKDRNNIIGDGVGSNSNEQQQVWKLVAEYPFDSTIKRMSTIAKSPEGNYIGYLKGATERVLQCCVGYYQENGDIKSANPQELEDLVLPQVDTLASGGLRVLSLAMRKMKAEGEVTGDTFTREDVEQDMIFLGLVGIYDPPREESKYAVESCHQAGITVHMLTGDHIATATAIAREVRIIPEDYGLKKDTNGHQTIETAELVMSAQKFDKLTEEEIDRLTELPLVIARCSPDTKVKMIEALHRRKKIAAMTGDGVNDSPSLKESDIGIAMGEAGSDVAKQAADIVLVDDNFSTIVSAIQEGRRVFSNISRFVVHMVSANVSEVTPLLIGLAFKDTMGNLVFPMSPIQILFNNILTSSPPAMSLGLEPIHADAMTTPPRTSKQSLFCLSNLMDILYYGFMIGLICFCNFIVVIWGGADGYASLGIDCNKEYDEGCRTVYQARGALFATLTVLNLLHGFTCRDLIHSTWSFKALRGPQNFYLYGSFLFGLVLLVIVLYVPVLNTSVFKHEGITWEWGMTAASVLAYIALAELWKALKRKFYHKI